MTIRTTASGRVAIAALMATMTLATPQAASAQDISFAGRTVEVMVNFAAGGATDSAARMIATYLPDHLPGRPTVIVTNRGGAGGTAAVDHLIDAVAPDGLTIGYFSGTPLRWSLGMEQVPEGTGDLPYVVAKSVNNILLTRADSGITIENYPGTQGRVFFALNAPDNHVAIRMRLLSDAVGVPNFELVSGYDTQPRMLAAVRASEVDMAQANDTFFGTNRGALLGDGVMTVFGQLGEFSETGIIAQGGLEDIPVLDAMWRAVSPETVDSPAYQAWEALHSAMSLQNVFVLPPNTPQAMVDVWEAAILAAYEDPRYIAQIEQIGMPDARSVGAAEIRRRMDILKARFEDPEIRAVIEAAIARNMQ